MDGNVLFDRLSSGDGSPDSSSCRVRGATNMTLDRTRAFKAEIYVLPKTDLDNPQVRVFFVNRLD